MRMLKRMAVIGLFGGALLVGAPRAEAVMLTGTISLSQTGICPTADCVIPVNGNVTSTLGTATGLDFTTSGSLTPNVAGPMSIDGGTGNFASLVGFGTIKDFCFAASGCGVYPNAPLAAWETANSGGTFDLSSVSLLFQNNSALALSGTGVFHVAGFDATPGTFTLTVNQTGGAFSFSATDAATPTTVPEPASMMLLGMGLLGFSSAIRRRRSGK